MVAVLKTVSVFTIPAFIAFILIYGHIRGVAVYETFVEGAKDGLTTAFRIIPYLVAMFVAIGIFRSSGAMGFVIKVLSPVLNFIGLPPEVLPLVIMRPMSGAASTGILAELLQAYGPDSYIGRTASTIMGSTETIFYTLSVYYGSVGVRNIRYTLAAGLLADAAGILASLTVCALFFGR